MTPKLKSYFDRNVKRINASLNKYLPKSSEKPAIVHQSMRYSINAGGKRLRPILVMLGAEVCGGKSNNVIPTACALELIHTYSLVHDDLPAMDNDDLRRGKPTNHKVYGDDIAILAGDALLTLAFKLIALNGGISKKAQKNICAVVELVADCAGTKGMVGGQVADIQSDQGVWKKNLRKTGFTDPKKLLEFIHLNKTAALIRASLVSGALLEGASTAKINALDKYAQAIGLTFQISDDILDLTADKKKLGKKGSDTKNQKLTFPAVYGLSGSKKRAEILTQNAHEALNGFGKKAEILHLLADFIIARDH